MAVQLPPLRLKNEWFVIEQTVGLSDVAYVWRINSFSSVNVQ